MNLPVINIFQSCLPKTGVVRNKLDDEELIQWNHIKSRIILPLCLAKFNKDSEYFLISALHNMVIRMSKQKMLKLKCISPEYFEYLLFTSGVPHSIKPDALLNSKILPGLKKQSGSWLNIQKIETESSLKQREELSEVNDQSNLGNKNKYLIQSCCVSLITESEHALYVTNQKYFDILQTFNVEYSWDSESCDVKIDIFQTSCGSQPALAEKLELGYIQCGNDVVKNAAEEAVKIYFSSPRYLKKNEVFSIDVQKILLCLDGSERNMNAKKIYFKVLGIYGCEWESNDFDCYIVNGRTKLEIKHPVNSYLPSEFRKFLYISDNETYEIPICPDGLDQSFLKLKKILEFFLKRKNDLKNLNLKPIILLNGMKGSGKKTVLRCVAARLGMSLLSFDCFNFVKMDRPTFETKFSSLIKKVQGMSPVIFHLENIELVGRDENYKEDVTMVGVFQKSMSALFEKRSPYPVVVVGTCNQKIPELIPSIERMFIETVQFKSMKKNESEKLLKWLVQEAGMTCGDEVLRDVSERTNGYLFADIVKLMRIALKYQREDETLREETKRSLNRQHMDKALGVVERSYSDSIGSAKVPSVYWEDVGGLEKLKEEITISLNFTSHYPELMVPGLRASGFLFYGPPGTGKTLMAKAVATEFKYNFLSVKGPELMNMYVGQSEKNVREVFQRARDAAPCVIFFDELDSLAPNRGGESSLVMDRIVSQLMTEMDGLESNAGVFVIGATNRPDLVDQGLLRPGRFDKMFYVGICSTKEMQLNVMKALTRRFSLDDDIDMEAVVDELPAQVTGADLYSVCSTAWVEAAHRYIHKVNANEGEKFELPVTVKAEDFEKAVAGFVPSLTPELIQSYENFRSMER